MNARPLQFISLGIALGFALGRWTVPSPQAPAIQTEVSSVPTKPSAPAPTVTTTHAEPRESPSTTSKPSTAKDMLAELRLLDLSSDVASVAWRRHEFVARFAEIDPESALTYVATLSGEAHEMELANALSVWAKHHPQAAADYLSDSTQAQLHGDDAARTGAQSVAAQWATRDPAAALNWARELPDNLRSSAITTVLAKRAEADSAAAIREAIALSEVDRPDAYAAIAQQLAIAKPENTAAWVTSLRDPSEQAAAAHGLTQSWMQRDPTAASKWVTELPGGDVRDQAIAALVQAPSIRNDPEAAVRWAASVSDATTRKELIASSLKRWSLIDAAAATAWAQANAVKLSE